MNYNLVLKYIVIIVLLVYTTSCNKWHEDDIPIVETNSVTNVKSNKATFYGNVSVLDSNVSIKRKGFCFNTEENPTILDILSDSSDGTGNFSTIYNNFKAETNYYVRAYAITYKDILIYGKNISFTTAKQNYSVQKPIVTIVNQSSAQISTKLTINNFSDTLLPINYGILVNEEYKGKVNLQDYLVKKEVSSSINDSFSDVFENLITDVEYIAVAYAVDNISTDTIYTDIVHFTPVFNPAVYSDLSSSNFTEHFIDNFSNNTHSWWTGSENGYSVNISNGNYNVQVNNNRIVFYPDYPYDTYEMDFFSKDFQIDVKLRINSLDNVDSYAGIGWDLDVSSVNFSGILYTVNNIGLDIWTRYSYEEKKLFQYNFNDSGNYQIYSIRKYEDNIYYFINENLIYTMNNSISSNPRLFGFICKDASMSVDYFNVNYIE